MMKKAILPVVILLMFAVEILRIYFIMPFPGSQYDNTIRFAYFIDKYAIWFRIVLYALLVWQLYRLINTRKWIRFSISLLFIVIYCVIGYFLNYRLNADKMFLQPQHKLMVTAKENKVAEGKLVIGIEMNGAAAAYPIEIIGYHHQVIDTVGGKPVMVTYCTVCRTGRIYDPVVNNKPETFRLVGMDHFNAMFEDATTHTWWRQATGEAIAGKLKGQQLKELHSEQTTLHAWLRMHPDSKILQADSAFMLDYAGLTGYDEGTIESDLEYRDFASGKFKSWVVGIDTINSAIMFDWNMLIKNRFLEHAVGEVPVILFVENDSASFHAYDRRVKGQELHFSMPDNGLVFIDKETGSEWNYSGLCISGVLLGNKLKPVTAHQEFHHSWMQFHPESKQVY